MAEHVALSYKKQELMALLTKEALHRKISKSYLSWVALQETNLWKHKFGGGDVRCRGSP